jgi:hypothetical protein
VLAAGLAACVFLIWWPAHLPSTGVEWLVLRGLAWTLAFEILVLSFCPLENMATRALTRRHTAARARTVRGRLAAAPAQAKASGAVLLACTGLLLPGLMLAHPGRTPAPSRRAVQVVRKVVVRKVVRQRTVVVRTPAKVVQAPAPIVSTQPAATVPASTPTTTAAEKAPKPATTANKTATAKKPPATKQQTKQATTPTTTTPAATTQLPDPAEAATPGADTAAPAADTAG